jgi:polyferredoxin
MGGKRMSKINFSTIRRRNQFTSFLVFWVLFILLVLSFFQNPWYKAPIEWYFIPVLGIVGSFILPAAFGRHYCGQYCPTSYITDGINPVNRAGKILKSRQLRKVFISLFLGIFVISLSPWKMGLPDSMTQTYWQATFNKLWILWLVCPFGIAFPLIFVLGFWKGGRTWCNYICPWGAIGVMFGTPQLKVTDKCNACKACTSVCSQPEVLEEAVNNQGGTIDKNCLTCMKCVDTCQRHAIEWIK